jgi:cephalosporin hydroxylase
MNDQIFQTRQTYCGVTMWTSWAGLFVIDRILDEHPVDKIIELGTMNGGLSMFLADQARWRGIPFMTFDVRDARTKKEGYSFQQKDILYDPEAIIGLRMVLEGSDRVLLYCDNGNKPREVAFYAPSLKPGSVLGVHDWPKEIDESHVKGRLDPPQWEPIYHNVCESLWTRQRFWVRSGGFWVWR